MTSANRQPGAQEARTRMAYKIMQSVYERCRAEGLTPEQTHQAIKDAYPWGKRRAWPYKAWLMARREFYEAHDLPLRARRTIAESLEADA